MPSNELFMVGITGTNGKTTTSFLVKHLLDKLKYKSGLIGTIEYIIGDHRYPATRTTPDIINNQKMLREMVLQGCKSSVMEVSSHALDQSRVEHIDFDIAIFTNLSLDHLDYHKDMADYAAAKAKLFTSLSNKKTKKKCAIVNNDSIWTPKITQNCKEQILTYGIANEADLRAVNISLSSFQTSFDLIYQGKSYACNSPMVGRFNIYNYLAAILVGIVKNESLEKLIKIMEEAPKVPGRLEPVDNALGLQIYVDFAHSDDALENVLNSLKELNPRSIITVFGCGGDRDKSKRHKMGEISEKLSDYTIITSDNPRSENPETICAEIAVGFKLKDNHEIVIDRRAAIKRAVELCKDDEIILIAGKGHESYQIFAHQTIEFDDRQVVQNECQLKFSQLETIR